MQHYIGTKLIQAEPMNLGNYNMFKGWTIPENEDPNKEGYLVKYSDDYISWSPKDVFENSYMQLTINENLKSDKPSISSDMVQTFVSKYDIYTLGDKTTVVKAILKNGFEIVESSSCVSAENYDEELGATICKNRIENKIWELLGFLLQTAVYGVKGD